MDKLKNLIKPGHNKDDDVMYGSGNQSTTTGSQGMSSLHSELMVSC